MKERCMYQTFKKNCHAPLPFANQSVHWTPFGNATFTCSSSATRDERVAPIARGEMFYRAASRAICLVVFCSLYRRLNCSPLPFLGVSKEQYWGRASAVYYLRTKAWVQGKPEGSSCNLEGERCSLDLLCVGPSENMQCHKAVQHYDHCDREYKVCDDGLICIDHRCLKETKLLKGIRSLLQYVFGWQDIKPSTSTYQVAAYMGVPAKHYWARASAVHLLRDKAWNDGTDEGFCIPACAQDFRCAGPTGEKQCRKPVEEGGECDKVYKVCGDGVHCWEDKCVKEALENEECSASKSCAEGLYCHAEKNSCQKLVEEYEKCSSIDKCAKGLVCDKDTCREEAGQGIDEKCGWYHGNCKRGLKCTKSGWWGLKQTCKLPS